MLDAKMKDKVTSVVLCAVLVFYAMVPISDFQKPQKAEAVAPAIAAVSVFGTALVAAGVYVAGTSAADYEGNLGSIYDGFSDALSGYSDSWAQYVQDQGSMDAAMQSAVTADGNISLQTLQDNGFFDTLGTYTAYCVDNGTAVVGDDSLGAVTVTTGIGSYSLANADSPLGAAYSSSSTAVSSLASSGFVYWLASKKYTDNGRTYIYDFYGKANVTNIDDSNSGYFSGVVGCAYTTVKDGVSTSSTTSGSNNKLDLDFIYAMGGVAVLNSDTTHYTIGNAAAETTAGTGDTLATVEQAVIDGTAAITAGVVQAFEPTAEMIEAGFSKSDVIAANTGEIAEATGDIATDVGSILTSITTTIGGVLNDIKTGVTAIPQAIATGVEGLGTVLNDIKTGVQGLEQVIGDAVAGALDDVLGDVLGDISTTLDNVWNGVQDWWADVLAWLGATPLAQLIAEIIAAINAGVMTLEGAISAVQSWINAGVAEIVGAIEGIGELMPGGTSHEEPTEPQTGTGVALPPSGLLPSFELELRDKAPFAYIVAFFETFQDAANTFSSNASFYLDLKIPSVDENGLDPDGDELRLDAGEWLNYTFDGGVTIAFMIRVLVTASICAGLIYVMYNAYLYAFRQ